MGPVAIPLGFKSKLFHLVAHDDFGCYLMSLYFSFLLCEMGINKVLTSWGCAEN